jgi:flagellum-specific peptidoglycan hydrolase FlgJ
MANESVKAGVKVTREAAYIGDFKFNFQGNLIEKYIEMKDAGKLHKYEKEVMELMAKHYAFYGQFQEENEYVTKGSILRCSGGNKMITFDILNDHGVEKAGSPLGICTDCKANENIHTFGECKRPTPEGYPERPIVIPTLKSKLPFIMHKCIPILNGSWSKTKSSKVKIWNESVGKYVDAITTGDFLVCLYGGIIEVIEVPTVNRTKGSGDVFSEWAKTNRTEKIKFLEPFVQLAKDEELRTGVPWQATLGQIAYETGWGDEDKKIYDEYTKAYSYNLFGVKYTGSVNDTSKFVRTWTTEYINSSDLEKWKKEQSKWALNNDSLVNEGTVNGKLKIKIIQPFRRYTSYDDSIIDHTNVLEHERYSSANGYKNNPFIYVSIIGPIYATGPDYGDTASIIMNDYFAWNDKDADWEEYNNWKSSR